MVEKESISKSFSSLTLSQFTLKSKKKMIDNPEFFYPKKLNLICNFYFFDFKNKNLVIRLYSTTIINYQDPNEKDNLIKIKSILRSTSVKSYLKKIFPNFNISENNIYVITEEKLGDNFFFDVCQSSEGFDIVDSNTEKQDSKILRIEIKLKKVFSDQSFTNREDANLYLHYINIFLKKLLKGINYVQSDPLQKSIYYSKSKEKILTDNNEVYFSYGYKISLNFYENNNMLLKCNQKFRLQRDITFYDLLNQYSQKRFRELVINKKGLTNYSFRTWRIDDVDFNTSPKNEVIIKDNGEKIVLLEYYRDKYKIIIKDQNQPLLVHYDKRKTPEGGEKIVKKYYLVPELLTVVGKLDEKENYAKFTIIDPHKKYSATNKVVVNLSKAKDLVMGEPEIQNIDLKGHVIKTPKICFGKKYQLEVNSFGVFNIDEKCEPIDDAENNKIQKKNWLLMYVDQEKTESKIVYSELSKMPIFEKYFESPEIISLNIKMMYDLKYYESYMKQELEKALSKLNEEQEEEKKEKKKKKKKNYKLALIIINSKFKDNQYTGIKNVLNYFRIPSQVILFDRFLKKMEKNITPVSTKILFSMLSKTGVSIYHPEIIEKKVQKSTLVCGYSTGKCLNNRMVTCLTATLDYKLYNPIFLCEYQEENAAGISNTIPSLILSALEQYFQYNDKYPKNIVIYRESVTPKLRGLILEMELEEIKSKLKETFEKEIKIVFIFVNKQTDVRLFMEGEEKRYENIPVGTLVESTITSNEYWEFIINSTSPRQGTARPTNYIIGYDSTDLTSTFIYRLTYYLTFSYYNNNCSVRLPAHLMNTTRLANFISKHLKDDCNMPKFSNSAL